jgi:hypothetical protein
MVVGEETQGECCLLNNLNCFSVTFLSQRGGVYP